jgi:hypothetical protein
MAIVDNKILRNALYIFVLLFLISLLPLTAVSAQDTNPNGPTDDEVNAIAKQLYCPVCENIPLDVGQKKKSKHISRTSMAIVCWLSLPREDLTGWYMSSRRWFS